MLKILLLVFIVIPFGIWLGTMIAQLLSTLMMVISVAIGSFIHSLFRGKTEHKWKPPEYLPAVQMIIIFGLILSVYATVIGGVFNWNWLLSIGLGLRAVSSTLLLIDLFTLMILATIHGHFDFLGE
jgi:hypothetical protein